MHTPVIQNVHGTHRIQRKYFVNRIRDYQVSKCHAFSWAFFIHLFSTTAAFFAAAAAAAAIAQQNNLF